MNANSLDRLGRQFCEACLNERCPMHCARCGKFVASDDEFRPMVTITEWSAPLFDASYDRAVLCADPCGRALWQNLSRFWELIPA